MARQRVVLRYGKAIYRISPFRRCSLGLLLILIFLLSGCARSITLRVVDAETRQPIEGAVALAEWVDTESTIGYYHTYTKKVAEDVSDNEGKLTIPDAGGFLRENSPHIKIYKAGYVGWDSKLIYLGYYKNDIKAGNLVKRTDFSMKNQDIFLVPWDDEKHSYTSHGSFIDDNAHFSDVGMNGGDSKYRKAIEYEVPFYLKESRMLRERGD